MRSSGVTWVGDIPQHWDSGNIRRFATMKTGHTPNRSVDEYWIDCTIPWFTLADVWQLRDGTRTYLGDTVTQISDLGLANSAAELLPAGTVVLSRTASVGFAGVMPRPMATSQDFWNWICGPRLVPEYLMYVFRAMTQEFRVLIRGSTHQTIYQPIAAGISIPVPPLPEQSAIADYLDRETARIDDLIAEQEQLLSSLHARRAAVVSHCVTQPRLTSLRRVVASIRQGWSPNCEAAAADGIIEWGVLKTGCVNGGRFRPGENKRLPEDEQVRPDLAARAGELVVSRASTSELVGSAAVVPPGYPRLLLSDLTYALQVADSVIPEYVSYAFATSEVRGQIRSAAKGTSASMQKLSQRDIAEISIPLPDLEDQRRIVAHLDEQTGTIDRLVDECRELITLLKERRSALITAAVTGQIDVRD